MNKFYPTYKQSLLLILIWLLCTAVSALPVLLFSSIDSALGLAILYTLSMVSTITIALSLRKNWRFETSTFPIVVIFIAVVSMLSIHIVLEPLQILFPVSETVLKLFRNIQQQPYSFFFMVVIAAPILEEALFRGIILDGFLKNYKPWHGIFVSAFLFALIHGNLTQGIGAFALGLLFGWIYWKIKSLIPCILLHFINNLFAFAGSITAAEEDFNKGIRESMNNDLAYVALYILSIVIAVSSVWLIQKKYFNNVPTTEIVLTDETPVES